MSRPKTHAVRSFSLRLETLEDIREVVDEARLAGGASALAQDAISAWIKRYRADPKGWLVARGIANTSTPVSDDL